MYRLSFRLFITSPPISESTLPEQLRETLFLLPLTEHPRRTGCARSIQSGMLRENDLTAARLMAMVDDVPILR